MQLSFAEYWPEYPAGSHSTLVLVDAEACSVDDLFILLFGCNSPFQERAREARGYTAFSESEWVLDEQELPSLPGGFGWTLPPPSNSHQLRGSDYQARMRKICFQQSGQSLRTEELHRCMTATHGSEYMVDCTVAVTAPFGDCFRAVCRYSFVATGPDSCQLRIDYAMAYVKRMSGIARAMLEPAAESGIAKNFAQFMAVLADHVRLTDAVEPAIGPSQPSPKVQTQGAEAVSCAPEPAAKMGDTMAQSAAESVTALLTVAGSQRRVRSVVTVFVDDHLLDLFLPAAEVLLISLGLIRSTSSSNVAVRGCAALLSTSCVLVLIQQLLNLWHNGGEWCETHSSWMLARLCVSAHRSVDLPRSVTGIVVAAVAILLVRSILGKWAGQMTVRQRVRWSQEELPEPPADTSETNNTAANEPQPEVDTVPQPPNVHLQRLQAVGNFITFRWDRLGGQQQRPHAAAPAQSVFDARADAKVVSASGGAGSSGGLSAPLSSKGPVVGSKRAAVSVGASKPISRNNSGILNSSGKLPTVAVKVGSPQSSGELSGKLSADGLKSHPAAGIAAGLDPSPRSPEHSTAPSARTSAPARSRAEASASSFANTSASGQSQEPVQQGFRPADGMVVEEVFENERWQPFRGWGHTWPGHFLPTDPVRHWCDANGKARSTSNRQRGMEFDDAAPALPDGWIWVDAWKIDVSGHALRICDAHGWHYGFNFLQMPFHGRPQGLRIPCVRRRRWVRVRVLQEWGPVCPDMQLYLVPSVGAVCPSVLGADRSAPGNLQAENARTGSAPCLSGSNGGDNGGTHRRHVSADASNGNATRLLSAQQSKSQSTPAAGLLTLEQARVEHSRGLAQKTQCTLGTAQLQSRPRSADGHLGQVASIGPSSRQRYMGGESFGSGSVDRMLSVRRRTASTPATAICRGQSVSGDVTPDSEASPGSQTPVPSPSSSKLTGHRRGPTQSSRGGKDGRNIRNWFFPSDDAELASRDLLRIYSERMYGGSSI